MAKKRYSFAFDAPVSILLVLSYLAVYALNIFLSSRAPLPDGETLISYLFTCSTIDLKAPLDYVRLFCHVLGSDVWNTMLVNALLLLLLGRSAEEACGSVTLAVMLLLAALVSGVLTCLLPGLSAQGPDPLIFMLLLLNFLAGLAAAEISCSWILAFLAFTALRSYAIIGPLVPASFRTMVHECIPIFISLAGGIAGSLPAFLLMSRSSSRGQRTGGGRPRPAKNKGRSGATTIIADNDDSFTDTLEI